MIDLDEAQRLGDASDDSNSAWEEFSEYTYNHWDEILAELRELRAEKEYARRRAEMAKQWAELALRNPSEID